MQLALKRCHRFWVWHWNSTTLRKRKVKCDLPVLRQKHEVPIIYHFPYENADF